MLNKSTKIIQTRSSFDRRKSMNRRSFLKHDYPCHNLQRRVIMIKRRMIGDRRSFSTDIMNTFWTETD